MVFNLDTCIKKNKSFPIVFRVDASLRTGLGHFSRCLVLANSLTRKGFDVVFVSIDDELLNTFYGKHSFTVLKLPRTHSKYLPFEEVALPTDCQERDAIQTANILKMQNVQAPCVVIVDHYFLDINWEYTFLSQFSVNIPIRVVILDDLTNRAHQCDILIDHVLCHSRDNYSSLIPPDCLFLGAPNHIILRPEFSVCQISTDLTNKKVLLDECMHIFLAMGAIDRDQKLLKIIEYLGIFSSKHRKLCVDLMISSSAPHFLCLKQHAAHYSELNIRYHVDIANPAVLMKGASMAITAGGLTSYELAALNIPMLLIPQSAPERKAACQLEGHCLAKVVDFFEELSYAEFAELIIEIASSYLHQDRPSTNFIDGLGVYRICDGIINMLP